MRGVNTKYFLAVLLVISLIGFVYAANTVALITPVADESISGAAYALGAKLDTNTLNLTNGHFFYQLGLVNITIEADVLNVTLTEFNTTWDTTAIQDVNNITVWANITNSTGFQTMDVSYEVAIDNGNPTVILAANNFHDNYAASASDTIQIAIDADLAIGIDNCTVYYTNIRTSVIDNITKIAAVGDACSGSYVISSIGGLTAGDRYKVHIEATDNNNDKTNSSDRSLMYKGVSGDIITIDGAEEPFLGRAKVQLQTTFRNISDSIGGFFNRIQAWFQNIFRRGE